KIMQQRLFANPKVTMVWDTVVDAALGDRVLTGVRVRNLLTGEQRVVEAGGLFYAIGHVPNTAFLDGQVAVDDTGYVVTKPGTTQTSVAGVFAAGDGQGKGWGPAGTPPGPRRLAPPQAGKVLPRHGQGGGARWP